MSGLLFGAAVAGLVATAGVATYFVASTRDGGEETTPAAVTTTTTEATPANATATGTAVDRTNVTVEEVVAALQKPGYAAYVEASVEQADGSVATGRAWHSADHPATRTEGEVDGTLTMINIDVPGFRAMLYIPENSLSDGPVYMPAGSPDPLLTRFDHVAALLEADEVEYRGQETLDGQQVVRFDTFDVRTREDGHETSSTIRTIVYLRASDLLPVRLKFSATRPGEGTYEAVQKTTAAEYVELSTLPPDFFDPDSLADIEIGPMEAVAVAGELPFATFWLGPRIDVAWLPPSGFGGDHQEVVRARVPGVRT